MHVELIKNIFSVGYVDWNVRDFHSYETTRGATYNAYLIKDQKTALIDTVKAPFAKDLLENIGSVIDPAKVDYVVCNHAEPDHAGALAQVLKALPNAALVCNAKCDATLSRFFDTSGWKKEIVETGDQISLGKRTLQFIGTPMVHWPESMFTYVPEDKLLFSMDAFGQHYSTSQKFDDEVSLETAVFEAKTYYANIITPYGRNVSLTMEKVKYLDIKIIAPSHGIVWRTHTQKIIDLYSNWVVCRAQPKVLVLYDSMWGSTEKMAQTILEGASVPGIEAHLIHVRRSSLTQIATEVLDAAAIVCGSSTLNRGLMPAMGSVLTYLRGLRPMNKIGFAFGSYGWSKGGIEEVERYLKETGWDILHEPIMTQYSPAPDVLEECKEAGKKLAERVLGA